MNIVITGVDELKKNLSQLQAKSTDASAKALRKITLDLKGKSQRLAPVKIGDLRRSAFSESNHLEGTVGFEQVYATYQHEHTEFVHPKGGEAKYLEKPYQASIQMYINMISNEIKKATGA